MELKPCPVCGRQPDVDECAPPVHGEDLGWYANCYRLTPFEHCIGVNADTKKDVIRAWNKEVAEHTARTSAVWAVPLR